MVSLPEFPKFEPHLDANVGTRWETWVRRFEQLLRAMEVAEDTRRRALLLHYAGPDVCDIFDTLAETGGDDAYELAKQKLIDYFTPQTNKILDIYTFRKACQEPTEMTIIIHD